MTDARILVVGGGAIGGITAAKLAGAVERVVVLDTNEEHVARLRDPGLRYRGGREPNRTVPLEAVGSADELDGEFDFALVAVKSPFHRAALEPLAATGKVESFVSLGNGLIQDRMAEIVGADRLLSCIVEWGGNNLGPGPRRARHDRADGRRRARRRGARAHPPARALPRGGGRGPRDAQPARPDLVQAARQLHLHRALRRLRPALRRRSPSTRTAARPLYAIWTEGVAVGEAEGLELETVYDVAAARARRPRRCRAGADDGDRRQHQAVDAAGPRAGPRDRGRRGQRRRRGARARALDPDAVQRPRRRARAR